jgi:hypothetical protein
MADVKQTDIGRQTGGDGIKISDRGARSSWETCCERIGRVRPTYWPACGAEKSWTVFVRKSARAKTGAQPGCTTECSAWTKGPRVYPAKSAADRITQAAEVGATNLASARTFAGSAASIAQTAAGTETTYRAAAKARPADRAYPSSRAGAAWTAESIAGPPYSSNISEP